MESCAKHTSHRSRLPERRRLRGGSPGRGRYPCGNLPWPAKPWRSFLAEPARSRIGQLPNTRKESGLCRKGQGRSSTDASPPNARNCRATRLPVPDGRPPKRLSVPGSRLANHPASETPEGARGTGAGLRPEGRCTLLGPGPKAEPARPEGTGVPSRPLRFFRIRKPEGSRSLEPLLQRNRSSEKRAAPADIRRFHVQEDALANCRSRQYKIAGRRPNLVYSFARTAHSLHILPTTLSTGCRATPDKRGLALTYVALRSKSQRLTKHRVS
jgi:hypothetical protein